MSSFEAICRDWSLRASIVLDVLFNSDTYKFELRGKALRILSNISAKSDPRCGVARNNIALIDSTISLYALSFWPRIYAYWSVSQECIEGCYNYRKIITDLFNDQAPHGMNNEDNRPLFIRSIRLVLPNRNKISRSPGQVPILLIVHLSRTSSTIGGL